MTQKDDTSKPKKNQTSEEHEMNKLRDSIHESTKKKSDAEANAEVREDGKK